MCIRDSPNIDETIIIKGSAKGPKIDPIPANNKKSPPPIPSFLKKILKIKFTIQSVKYPIIKP